ncbi:hypothetical protein HY632_01805 [Candidatus Uhrbacteria bacterium]|nr:hypothetical protein [Candidatus Uhrbacteria bacterium]
MADGGSAPVPAVDAGDPEPMAPLGRGTESRGLDVSMERAEIYHADGAMDTVVEEEIVLIPNDRVRIFLTATNRSNGWVPMNFELCVENQSHLSVLDQGSVELDDLSEAPVLEEPCAVRFQDDWPTLERGESREFLVGGVVAKSRIGGGYLTVYFRAEFLHQGVVDLFEYTIPYRVRRPPS